MGKTQYLLARGHQYSEKTFPVYVHLGAMLGLLDDEEQVGVALARLLAAGAAFDERTPIPTLERLDTGRYALLLDGLDEVSATRRRDVVAAILQAAATWTQHEIVVATRSTMFEGQFEQAGFTIARIPQSSEWGQRYLEARGVPRARLETMADSAAAVRDLAQRPIFAAAIGESLVASEALSHSGLGLLTDAVRRAIHREAKRWGRGGAELYDELSRLALNLQVSGNNSIDESRFGDFVRLDGKPDRWRERLLEAGLLVGRGTELVGFSLRPFQEALAADALLRCSNPTELVTIGALVEIEGVPTLRGDCEQWLDLIWEGAPATQREELRPLDEYRWFRTLPADAATDEADGLIEAAWHWHSERELVFDLGSGSTYGLTQSLQRLSKDALGVLTDFYGRVDQTRFDGAAHDRANAAIIACWVGAEADVAEAIADPDPAVHAAALSALRAARTPGLVATLRGQIAERPDGRYGYATVIVDTAAPHELREVSEFLLATCPSRDLIRRMAEKLTPAETMRLASTVPGAGMERVASLLLDWTLFYHDVSEWEPAGVEAANLIAPAGKGLFTYTSEEELGGERERDGLLAGFRTLCDVWRDAASRGAQRFVGTPPDDWADLAMSLDRYGEPLLGTLVFGRAEPLPSASAFDGISKSRRSTEWRRQQLGRATEAATAILGQIDERLAAVESALDI